MKKINKFLNEYGISIILFMVLILFFRTCGMNTKFENHDEYLKFSKYKLDSLIMVEIGEVNISLEKMIIKTQIEGLKNEKRMIQATDRKMVDYERQNQIEKEIKQLQKELNNVDYEK